MKQLEVYYLRNRKFIYFSTMIAVDIISSKILQNFFFLIIALWSSKDFQKSNHFLGDKKIAVKNLFQIFKEACIYLIKNSLYNTLMSAAERSARNLRCIEKFKSPKRRREPTQVEFLVTLENFQFYFILKFFLFNLFLKLSCQRVMPFDLKCSCYCFSVFQPISKFVSWPVWKS